MVHCFGVYSHFDHQSTISKSRLCLSLTVSSSVFILTVSLAAIDFVLATVKVIRQHWHTAGELHLCQWHPERMQCHKHFSLGAAFSLKLVSHGRRGSRGACVRWSVCVLHVCRQHCCGVCVGQVFPGYWMPSLEQTRLELSYGGHVA